MSGAKVEEARLRRRSGKSVSLYESQEVLEGMFLNCQGEIAGSWLVWG